jgi:GNAT superfamily N-acetyltransferase/predicted nucleic acid-binding protein
MDSAGSEQVVVRPVGPASTELEQVKTLWRRNSATLGFFCAGAFDERAQKKQILSATINGEVVGYLIFFRNRRDEIRITHLCVDESKRGCGIARQLIETLIARAKDASRIRLWCCRDFEAWSMWPRLGFVAFRQKPGKKRTGSELTEFRRELNPLPLFAVFAAEQQGVTIVVDTNVFLDLVRPDRPFHEESCGLEEDWLAAETQLCITSELYNDVQRSTDPAEREALLKEARFWEQIEANPEDLTTAERQVVEVFGRPGSDQDRSDHRHLAWALAGKADAFATRDEPILAGAEAIYERTGLLVGRPAELIAEYDVLINERDYQRRELVGSGVQQSRLGATRQFLPDPFIDSGAGESARRFRASMDAAIAHPNENEVWQVSDNKGNPLAVYLLTVDSTGTMAIRWFRLHRTIVETRLGRSLVRFLLADVQRRAAAKGIMACRMEDARAADAFAVPLRERGFVFCGNQWWKACLPGVWVPERLCDTLSDHASRGIFPATLTESLVEGMRDAVQERNACQLLEMEDLIWPGKIAAGLVDNFVIPIQPRWAADLFDIGLRNRPLLDAEPDLLLNPESAYYKAARGGPSADFGRILWYVSQHEDYPGAGRVRACSRMTERVTGPAIIVYRRFRHLGVYLWRNVRDAARGENEPVMGIGFTNTELLPCPVDFHQANAVLERYSSRSPFVTATKVPEEAFFDIYHQASEASGLNP